MGRVIVMSVPRKWNRGRPEHSYTDHAVRSLWTLGMKMEQYLTETRKFQEFRTEKVNVYNKGFSVGAEWLKEDDRGRREHWPGSRNHPPRTARRTGRDLNQR